MTVSITSAFSPFPAAVNPWNPAASSLSGTPGTIHPSGTGQPDAAHAGTGISGTVHGAPASASTSSAPAQNKPVSTQNGLALVPAGKLPGPFASRAESGPTASGAARSGSARTETQTAPAPRPNQGQIQEIRLLKAQGQDLSQIAVDLSIPVSTVSDDLKTDIPKPPPAATPLPHAETPPTLSVFA